MKNLLKGALLAGALALGVATMTPPALAADAKIGIRAETASVDPHFSYQAPNKAAVTNIFDTLIVRDKDLKLTPALATEWGKVDPTTWEFKLRPNVTWHDGQPFTADDVIFTLERAGKVPNSPAPFTQFLSQIASVEKVDDLTLRIHTPNESTQVLMDLSEILIVSRHAGEGATTEDYNSGKATIGTGPYKFVSWAPGAALSLDRYDGYWGQPAAFKSVDIIPIPNDAGRVAALLAGDVDLIDAVPPDSVERLRADQNVEVWEVPDVYAAFLHMDSDRDVSPGITAKDGSPIPNPLLDRRVREALALSIDRDAIISRLMFGLRQKASQLAGVTMIGFNPDIPQTPYDPEKAKALLAGRLSRRLKMIVAGPNDRYVADGQITQAVAQMFERIGIATEVETMPTNVHAQGQRAGVFDLLHRVRLGTGTAWSGTRAVLMTYDRAMGYGTSNRVLQSRSRPAEHPGDERARSRQRGEYAAEASAVAYADFAIIPLHYQMNVWAGRKGFEYEGRQDRSPLPMD